MHLLVCRFYSNCVHLLYYGCSAELIHIHSIVWESTFSSTVQSLAFLPFGLCIGWQFWCLEGESRRYYFHHCLCVCYLLLLLLLPLLLVVVMVACLQYHFASDKPPPTQLIAVSVCLICNFRGLISAFVSHELVPQLLPTLATSCVVLPWVASMWQVLWVCYRFNGRVT